MSTWHPHTDYIERLGGSAEVARLCRIKPQAVSQWKRAGIPPARMDYLQLLRPEAFAAGPTVAQGAPDMAGAAG